MKSPSPRPQGRGGAMARVLPGAARYDARVIRNIPFDTFGHAFSKASAKNTAAFATTDEFMRSAFGDSFVSIAKGGYGETFSVVVNASIRQKLVRLLHSASNVLVLRVPPVGYRVLIKVSLKSRAPSFLKDAKREAAAQVQLWKYPAVHIRKCKLRARDYTPEFFAFCTKDGVACTVMEYVDGVPLKSMERTLSAEGFLAVERAILSHLVSGVEHSDMHFQNIIMRRREGHPFTPCIIDFGFAVRLPEGMRKRFVEFAGEEGSSLALDDIIKNVALRYTNAIQWKRFDGRLTFYNPTHSALRVLWKRMPEAQRDILCARRKELPVLACLQKKNGGGYK